MSLKRLHGLRKSDIVTIHLILSERTRGLVGAGTHETDGAVVARARRSNEPQPRQTLQTGFADRERMRQAFVRVFGLPPQAMRRQVRRDAQLARDVPSGSLPALRDADLVITQEPATLQHIPMFGAHDRARYMR